MYFDGFLRKLLKAKQYYGTVIFSLAITLSLLFSSFSMLDVVFLKGLPYKNTDELYFVEGTIEYQGKVIGQTNSRSLIHLQEKSRVFNEFAIYFPWTEYKLFDFTERPFIPTYMVSSSFFDTLGAEPEIGRLFNDTEKLGNKSPSVVLSKQAWEKYYDSSRDIVGKQIHLNNRSFTVVGVTKSSIPLPQRNDHQFAIYIPLDMDEVMDPVKFDGLGGDIKGIGRSTNKLEEIELDAVKHFKESSKLFLPNFLLSYNPSARVSSLQSAIIGDSQTTIMLMLIGSILLMAITLINLGNLQMAKAISQLQRISISYAFGASRKQIFKELAFHNTVVVGTAILISLAITGLCFDIIRSVGKDVIPRIESISINLNMVGIALLLLVVIVGLLSWIELNSVNENTLRENLQTSGKGSCKQIKESTSHLLIALQVCFSLLVLVSASQVFSLTFKEAFRTTGINVDRKYELVLNLSAVNEREERKNLFKEVRRQIELNPQVTKTIFSSEKRLPQSLSFSQLYNEKKEKLASVRASYVEADYFDNFSIGVDGKEFTKNDYELENPPVIINKRLAGSIQGNPIGKKIYVGDDGPYEVIGVATNTYFPGEKRLEISELYLPSEYLGSRKSTIIIHINNSNVDFKRNEIITLITKIDTRIDVSKFSTVGDDFSEASETLRITAYMSGIVSVISFTMVIAGIYGVVSYMTSLRRYDIGVKLAMGATNRVIFKQQLLRLSAPIFTALFFSFSLIFMLLGFSRTIPDWMFTIDWQAMVMVVLGLMVVLIVSSSMPIFNILKLDPIKALRNE